MPPPNIVPKMLSQLFFKKFKVFVQNADDTFVMILSPTASKISPPSFSIPIDDSIAAICAESAVIAAV